MTRPGFAHPGADVTAPGADVTAPGADPAASSTLLARILLPRPADAPDVAALYVEPGEAAPDVAVTSRTSVELAGGAALRLGTYFNAFPAGYWARWTTVSAVHLRVRGSGDAEVEVWRSDADARVTRVASARFVDGQVDIAVELTGYDDGGWCWATVTAGADGAVVDEAGWHADRPVTPAAGRGLTIGIPTFERPTQCVALLTAIAGDDLLRETVESVVVVDQGTSRLRDEDGFAAAAAALGTRLRVVEQPNYGGSGGFARVMCEAQTETASEHVLLLDDDVVLEPDSALRALAFARRATTPLLVGGQMLSLRHPSRLHAMGEVVDRDVLRWRTTPAGTADHDLATAPLASTRWLHRRVDVDFSGWWMCLVPRSVIERVGLPLPLFLKFDDAEYGLRAGDAGCPTVTMPGAAVWHLSFADKDDDTDWQAYYHLRNRLVTMAVLGCGARGALLLDGAKHLARHLLAMEYSTVAMQNRAVRDFLAGPALLFDALATSLSQVRAERASYSDAVVLSWSAELPPPTAVEAPAGRPGRTGMLVAGASALLRTLLASTSTAGGDRGTPVLPASEATWTRLSRLDAAIVATADGSGACLRRRDRGTAARLLLESVRCHVALARGLAAARRQYRAAVPELTSTAAWGQRFAETHDRERVA